MRLRWDDVDLVTKRMIVRRSDWRGHVGPTKTGTNREVPLGDEVLAALKDHRGLKHLKGGLVFCRPDGKALKAPECRRPLERACRKAELEPVGWPVLRHSFASQLAMAGAALKSVSELMGHTTIQMTMRYAHLSPQVRREAVLLLDGCRVTAL